MRTTSGAAVAFMTLSMMACAGEGEEASAEDIGQGSDAVVGVAATCAVDKYGKGYSAEARVTNRGLIVRIDGEEGRSKNKIEVDVRYEDGSTAHLDMAKTQPAGQWIWAAVPNFVPPGSDVTVRIGFDFSGLDRNCVIDQLKP